MKTLFFFFGLWCWAIGSLAQARIDKKKLADKSVVYDRRADERFAFQVKTIDEFMERFNNDESTLLRQYVEVVHPNAKIERKKLLKTLFKTSNAVTDSLKRVFIETVCDSLNPQYLNFFDNEWYAQANCLFYEGHQQRYLSFILKVKKTSNGGSKWVISGVEDFSATNKTRNIEINQENEKEAGLNPYNHVLNFTELEEAFDNPKNIAAYIDSNFLNDKTKPIIEAILDKQMNFKYVQQITYHFLQVDGWIFTVEDHKQMVKHSGWLIKGLLTANQAEKDCYKQAVLHLTIQQ
jgi:hypothetical protein